MWLCRQLKSNIRCHCVSQSFHICLLSISQLLPNHTYDLCLSPCAQWKLRYNIRIPVSYQLQNFIPMDATDR